MRQYYPTTGLSTHCRLFGKSRQAFYDHGWRHQDQAMQQGLILDLVMKARASLPHTGSLKLLAMLKQDFVAHGLTLGRDGFFKLLREHDLLVRKTRKYARTTFSNHHYRKWPNLVEKWQPDGPAQLWVSDITYVRTASRFVYLALVTDAYSHKIIGYHLSQQLKAQGSLIALQKAISSLQQPVTTLIHHSDRGIQYCCDLYVNKLLDNGIRISMTQSGSPYENAIAERVNGILKIELGMDKTFKDYGEAVAATHQAVDLYNRVRLHMSCGYLTPMLAHQANGQLLKRWKAKKQKKNPLN